MKKTSEELKAINNQLRKDILTMICKAGSGHPGGSLSAIDIITYLYLNVMHHDPKNPGLENRDRFVLSKGHGVPALYAVLAYCGYFPSSKLWSLRKLGSVLQGHPANRLLPGIEASTGSLGQGLSVALGMALSARLFNKEKPLFNAYAVLGDGELQEGQIWEAAMCASHYQVHNLLAIVDRNQGQIDGLVNDIMNIEPLMEKFQSFGWNVLCIDGHNFMEMERMIINFKNQKNKPTLAIANTIKGKGISFLESDIVSWHGKALSESELEKALLEL